MIKPRTWALLVAVPLLLLYLSLFIGRYAVSPADVAHILYAQIRPMAHDWAPSLETIVLQIRLPRALMALLVGAGLSAAGAAYQGLFRNPLVSPDILGVTAAAGFGAALALLLSRGVIELQLLSFVFGLSGVAFTYRLARLYRTAPVLMLVLAGVIVSAFFTALLSATKYIADPDSKLPAITYWLLGSLNGVSTRSFMVALPPMLIGITGLTVVRWYLNLLSMGDEDARALGLRVELMKALVIVCCTLITAAAVAVCGMVGWVGLVIPHFSRMLVGPDHRVLIPVTLSVGGSYLLLIDDVARVATVSEVPLGILTALIGAPFFAFLLRRSQGAWS